MFEIASVQVSHLLFTDVFHLSGGHLANFCFVRLTRTASNASSNFEQSRRRRALGYELETAVGIDGHHYRNGSAIELPSPFVELGDKLPQIDTEFTL